MAEPTRRILLAEDDRFLRKAAETALKRQGFTVLAAVDGEEALRMARAESPDLVLLDLIMPKLQGFEVLRALKADAATAAIPVIILSNLGQDSDVKQAMEAGAAGYFVKANLSLQDLVKRVGEVLDGAALMAGMLVTDEELRTLIVTAARAGGRGRVREGAADGGPAQDPARARARRARPHPARLPARPARPGLGRRASSS